MDKKKDNSFPFIPDMDCDGDHDFNDFLIFQDQMISLEKIEKEKEEKEKQKSRKPIKDYSWRENTEDGSDYVEQFDLVLNADGDEINKHDLENAILLHKKVQITDSQASDERLRISLCFGEFYPYMRNRWSIDKSLI